MQSGAQANAARPFDCQLAMPQMKSPAGLGQGLGVRYVLRGLCRYVVAYAIQVLH